ncbi:hypothetical protein SAMN02745206_03600 [Desulfacinum infernum DSM 9756]|jgi:hypothetical protein|uniref:Uncharacterized protein n=1 Tax=Desulfacinum infernum DSM 9756 TaxID=1121391 RepID=A0A1M5II93_9BACT|nr:hypothetical protein [Desulfacinum infernum]SHG27620.1 hypothetical protein SAMN02745206_03600 [Desulfacinum infernum DSM 9756]
MSEERKIFFLGSQPLEPDDANRLWYPVVPSDDAGFWGERKIFFPTWDDALEYACWINSGCPELAPKGEFGKFLLKERYGTPVIRRANQKYRIRIPRPLTYEEAEYQWSVVGPAEAAPGGPETALFWSFEEASEYIDWKNGDCLDCSPSSRSRREEEGAA